MQTMDPLPKDLIPDFFDKTSKTYDTVAFWATFGKDQYWKKEIVDKIHRADSILDLACGTGILTRMIAKKFPRSEVIGIDISKTYLDISIKKSLSNTSFVLQDAEKLSINKKFDCICSSYIPKYCNPKVLIKKSIDHLAPNGSIIFHDFVYPEDNTIQKFWHLHFALLALLGNFIPSWKFAFYELPKLIRKSNWVDKYEQELKKNGFDVTTQYLTCHSSAILYARKNT